MPTKDFLEHVPCNICGADDYAIVYHSNYSNETSHDLKNKFKSSGDETLIDQVVKCRHCGLIYINPRIKADLIIQGYSDGSDETFVSQAAGRERTFERCMNYLEKYSHGKKGTILDIGAANGSFLAVAKKRGWDVHGVEPNEWLCHWAEKHYGIEIKPTTIFEQRFPDNYFGVVTLWDVLEHVPDPTRVLKECNRILKDDGILVVNYPDIGSWIARLLQRKWVFLLSVHLYYFTPATVRNILDKTGFSVVADKPHFQSLELGYLMFRMKAYNKILHKIGCRAASALRMEKIQIPYWLGQTLLVSRKKTKQSDDLQ